ncbi:MAG: hypothetical protein ACRD1K_20705 [Acidimicrobiales bacterium]
MTITIELKVTQARAEGLVLQDLIDAQNGNLEAIRDTLAHFVLNGTGDYLALEDHKDEQGNPVLGARSVVGQMTLGEMKHYSAQMRQLLQDSAVPKASGTDSASPSVTD